MKTLKKQVTIPAEVVETTEYGCELCDFMSDDPDEVKRHYGETHACREERKIGGQRFVRFDAKDDMHAWADAQCSMTSYEGWHGTNSYGPFWQGPGWYNVKGQSEPCGHGCCHRYIMVLTPLAEVIDNLRESIVRDQGRLEEFRREFGLPADTDEMEA